MKKLLKRWLAMMLVVLMVVGTLPTTAWAARMTDDEVSEQPVLDGKNDPVVDTLGRYDDDGEKPEKPVDPEGPPAEILEIADNVKEKGSFTANQAGHILQVNFPEKAGTNKFTVAVVPNFRLDSATSTIPAAWAEAQHSTRLNSNADLATVWKGITASYPVAVIPQDTAKTYHNNTFTWAWDGTMTLGTETLTMNGISQAGSVDQISQKGLGEWYLKNTKPIFDKNGAPMTNPTSLPFKVYMWFGDNSYIPVEINIPISAQPLTVKVVPNKQVAPATIPFEGWSYGTVEVTNNTGEDMTGVEVVLNRGMIEAAETEPDGWSQTTVGDDEGNTSDNIVDPTDPDYDDYILGGLYGFEDSEGTATGNYWGKVLVDIPAGETVSLSVIMTGAWNDVTITDVTGEETDTWANYTAVATKDGATDSDNAGIRWALVTEFKPKIRLVDTAGVPIDVNGKGVRNNTATNVQHKVRVGALELFYDTGSGYYVPADADATVSVPNNIYVDEVYISGQMITSDDGIDIIMYKLEVVDDPTGKAAGNLGSFIGETPINVTNRNAVQFDYYPPKSPVRVWANNVGFSSWLNAIENNDFAGANSTTEEVGRIASLTGDTTVVAYYLPDITMVTTLGGRDVDYTHPGHNRNFAHVHSIQVKQGNTVVASAVQKTDGSYTLTNIKQQSATQPWQITVAKGTYTLVINGFTVETIDTDALPGTTPMYIEELAGVKPVVTGAQEALTGFSMLPDDLNPNRGRGPLDFDKDGYDDGTNKHTDTVLYYPVGATVEPYVFDGNYDRLETLTYPAGTSIKPGDYVGDGTDQPSITIVSGAEQELKAVYGQSLELWMYLDGTQYTTDMAGNIVLKPVGAADDSGNIAVTQSDDYGYIYTSNSALAAGTTYEIWVNGFNTKLTSASTKSTATLDDTEHSYIPVPMQKVTVADQAGITTTAASSFSGGSYTNVKTGNIPSGCTISVKHGTAENYAADGWTFAVGTATTSKGDFTYTASATTGADSQGAQTLTAKYVASVGKATVNIYLDKNASNTPVKSDAPVKSGVALYKGTTKVKDLSKSATGVYSDSVAPDTYNVYVNGKDTGIDLEVTTAGASTDVQYWTVSVATDGHGSATMTPAANTGDSTAVPATNATAKTAVVQDGTSVTWAYGSPSKYYTADQWDTSGSAADITATVGAATSHTANFKKLTATITVNLQVDDTTKHPGGSQTVTVTGQTNWVTTSDATKVFTVEQGNNYTVTLGTFSKTINAIETNQTVDIPFYTLKVTAEQTIDSGAKVAQSTTDNPPTANQDNQTGTYLTGTTVYINAAPSGNNYSFTKWKGKGNLPTTVTTAANQITLTEKTELTAEFSKPKYDAYLNLLLNDDGVTALGGKITSVKLGNHNATYDEGTGLWKYAGVVSASESNLKWSVATPDGTFTANQGTQDSTTAPAKLELYTLKLTADQTKATAAQVGIGTTATAQTVGPIVYEKGTVVSIIADPKNTDYEWDAWTVDKGGITAPSAASSKVTMNQETELTATFKKKLGAVTVEVLLDNKAVNDATVTLAGKTTTSISGGVYTFSNMEYNSTAADKYALSVSKSGYVGAYTASVTVDKANVDKITVKFWTVTAATTGHGNAKVEVTTAGLSGSAETDYAATTPVTSKSIVVLEGTAVKWTARDPETNYKFNYWDTTETDKTNPKTLASVTSEVPHTANFIKDKYNTYLVVNVNTSNWATKGTSDTNIKEIQLVNTATGTASVAGVTLERKNDRWEANGVSSESVTAPYWRITTFDGGVYYEQAKVDDTTTKNFYGVKVVDTKPTGCTGATVKAAGAGSTAGVRVVTPVGNVTAAETHSTGYTLASWKQTNDPALTNVGISGGTVTLQTDYNAATDLIVTPTYTFSVTIRTMRGSTATPPGGAVVVADADDNVKQTWSNFDGSESLSGLDPTKTYKISVNGFVSDVTFTNAKAGQNVDVTLYTVSTAMKAKHAAAAETTEVGNSTAYVNLGVVGTTTKKSVYLPQGATTDTNHTVNVAARAGTNYRLANHALNGADSTLWTVASGGAIAAADTTPTTLNITTALEDDIEVVAHFVRQFTATVQVAPTGSKSEVGFTKETVYETSQTVDAGGVATAVLHNKAVGESLDNWTFAKGTLYHTEVKAGNEITSGQGGEYTTVYFVPTDDGATLTANIVEAVYPVTVKVNLDNVPYAKRTVELRKGGVKKYELTETATAGTYTASVLPDDYDIFVDGVKTGTLADTEKNLNFSAADAESTDVNKLANLSAEVNYYTLTVEKAFSDGGTSTAHFANHGAVAGNATAEAAAKTKIVLAKTAAQANQSVGATNHNHSGSTPFYRFDTWTSKGGADTAATPATAVTFTTNAAAGVFTLPDETTLKNNATVTGKGIVLTANFQREFKVEVKKADTSWSFAVGVAETAPTGGAAWPTYVFVDKDDPVLVYSSTNLPNDRAFKEWSIQSGDGTFTNTGTASAVTDKGLTQPKDGNNTFTPTADSVLVLDLWQDATLFSGAWTHDWGTSANNSDGTGGKRPTLTWTKNDAQEELISITVAPGTGASVGTPAAVTEGPDYTVSADGKTYTFTDTYLRNLTKGSYTVTFTYTLGADGHTNTYTPMTKSVIFHINPSAYKLTEVYVWAENKNAGDTASADDENRDAVMYRSHKVENIEHGNLTFTWYVSNTAPTQQNFNNQTDPAAAAKAAADAVGTPIDASKVSGWTEDGNTIDTGKVAVDTSMQGKYIFAVVTASESGEGAVITNSIPVDYDAKITVNKDGSHVTADNYKVFLVPSGKTVAQTDFASDAALAAKGIKKADSFDAATGIYSTTGSALTGATNYVVWVSDAEGSAFYLLATEAGTVTPLSNTGKNVNYFSVNRKAYTYDHFEDSKGNEVGETFGEGTTPAINSVTTSNGSTVADGNGVHTGTSVTAKSSTWNQDYTLTWKKSTGNDPVAPTTTKQNSTTANATGYANGAVTAKTNIGGELVQNTYLIRGDIKGSGSVATAKLTANGHEFTGKVLYSGAPGTNVVEFTVPKSAVTGEINGNYVISATMGANTTLVGYSAPSKPAADQVAPLALEQVTKAENGKFAIHIVSTTLSIEVKDTDNEAHKQSATGGSATATVNHSDKEKFADYNQYTRTVVITNQGNTPLTVTLGITKGTNTTVYDGTQTLTGGVLTDGNGVTIGGLERTFDLAVNGSKSFVVTIPADLNNDDDVAYHFNFSTVDGRDGVTTKGPDGVYNLNITIDPVTVSKVATNKIKDSDGNVIRYEVKETWVAEDGENPTTKPHYDALVTMEDTDDYDKDTNADIVYEWYVAPWNAKVTLDKTTGVPKYTNDSVNGANAGKPLELGAGVRGTNYLTYEPTAEEKGMALFLVAKGQRDATSAAMTPDVDKNEPVELVPFDGLITIHENTDQVTTQTEGEKYTVYLWNTQGGDEIDLTDTENLIPTEWVIGETDAKTGFKSTKNLWASDPENPDSTKPWTYKVYASIAKGEEPLKYTGKTITVGHRTEDVVYYQVDVDTTSVHQNDYEGKLDIPDNSKYFYKTAPTPRPSAAAEGVAGKDVVNGWVQTGTKVTFTYPKWEYDYDLTWSGGVTGTDTAAAGNAGAVTHANVTYSSQLAQVKTQLKLNLYPVKANATGTAGWVNYLTMALTDGAVTNTFTSLRTQTDNILGIDDSQLDAATNYRIGVGKSVTFRLPKADGYTTTAHVPDQASSGVASWYYRYDGKNTDGDMDNPGDVKITVNVTGNETADTYDVNLTGEGLNMKVTETALPKDKTSAKALQSGMGSIPNADTADVTDGTVNQEIHLNYNYPTGQTVVMEVENTTEGTAIWNVRSTPAAGNIGAITASSFTGGKMEPAAKEEITLTIADGLDAGEYKYSADFSFENKETGGRSAKVTYTLKVVVDPLPFTNVTIKKLDNGTLSIDKYQVTPTGAATATETEPADPVAADDKTALTYGDAKDYQYQWYAADAGSAQPTVTWAAGVPTVSGATAIAGATNKTFDPSTQQGKDIYLVIYANNDSNASQAAISTPITSTFQGVVKISVNGTTLTADPGVISGTTDPAYTVKFVNGSDKIQGVWNNAAQGYVAALEPTKTYTVEVSRAKDDKTNLVTLADVSISNANRTATAPYFTVNAVNFVNEEYQTGTGEDFTGVTITPAFTIGTDHAALPNHTPVLSGQSVAAKAPALSAPNADKAWIQDYTLTWRQKSDDNTATTVTDANLADSTTKGQSATAAIANGAYAYGTVTHKTFIGGRLDQKTYEVVGTVKNETDMTGGHVLKVELAKEDDEDVTFVSQTTDKDAANYLTNNKNDGVHGAPSDTVTFTVVKGVYNITAYDGANTTIQRVTIDADDKDVDKTRNKETLTPAVANNDRVFTIYVAGTALKLKVADNEGNAPHNNATSEGSGNVATNYKHAYNEETHYFNATTGTFPLTLSNPGNTDLKLGQPKVYKLAAGSVNASTDMTGVTLGTALVLTSGSYSDDNLTISGLGTINNTALAVGKTTSGGSLTLKKTAANKDDAVYVVEFPSTYADTNGNTPAGPTVYYVLDLTVEPLPIVSVTTGKNATTGELSLEGYDKNDAANKTGLDHVMVDHDGSAATDAVAANSADANLKDADISFVWAVSDKGDLTAANFEIDTANNKMVAKDGVATVDTTLGKTRQPSAAEEGKFFYLIAYRSAGTANASEFAVSDAVYAQVTVTIEAYRTNTETEIPVKDGFTVTGKLDDDHIATAQKGKLVVDADESSIAFTADEADNTDPSKASYYFVQWGAKPTGGITVDEDDRLAMAYAVTQQATVIGYYDLLPTLTNNDGSGSSMGYNNSAGEDVPANRTMKYTHNDGSGTDNVVIVIEPMGGATFKGALEDSDKVKLTSTSGAFASIAGETKPLDMKLGVDGAYVLDRDWIISNLNVTKGTAYYQITFYDTQKGQYSDPMAETANDGGYAGYDRAVTLRITGGEVMVTARVEDKDDDQEGIQGWGQVQTTSNDATNGDGGKGDTSTAKTSGGQVTIEAFPDPGYVFVKWTVVSEDMDGTFGDDTAAKTTFTPDGEGTIVEASFRPATFEATAGNAQVYYGNTKFEDTPTQVTVKPEDGVNTLTYTYKLLTEAELTAYLDGAARPDNVYTTDGVSDGTNTTNVIPAWLNFATNTGVFSVNAAAKGVNVEKTTGEDGKLVDVTDELVVYVKITSNGGAEDIVPFTVDVMTTPLEIDTPITADNYVAAYKAGEGVTEINHGDPVKLDYFTYTGVRSTKNNADVVDSKANAGNGTEDTPIDHEGSKWTVAPTTFNGTGSDPALDENEHEYTFTFTYKPDNDAEKWNYAATSATLKITAKKPPQSIQFADAITNYADVTVGRGDDYSAFEKDEEATKAPEAMAYTDETYRQNETLTYLDTEPQYQVKFQAIGKIYGATWTTNDLEGFKVAEGTAMPTYKDTTIEDVTAPPFTLELAPKSKDIPTGYVGDLWVGEHHAKFTVSGFIDENKALPIEATYELTIVVAPKVITSLDVTVTDPETEPTEVKGTTEDNKPVDNETPDDKGNVPVKDVTVTWKPEPGEPDGKHTEVDVTVEIDPNYVYVEEDDTTPDVKEDITENTDLTVTDHLTPDPVVTRDPEDGDHIVHITQKIPYLMHDDVKDGSDPADKTGPKVDDRRTVSVMQGAKDLGSYTVNLGAYGEDVYDVQWTIEQDTITTLAGENGIGAVLKDAAGNPLTWNEAAGTIATAGPKASFVLDLSAVDTSKVGTYTLTLKGLGKANADDAERTIQSTYVFQLTVRSPGGGGGVVETCPCKVLYHIGIHGTTEDATIEDVSEKNRPSKVPAVTPVDGYVFRGWSLTNPATLKDGQKIELVDPKTVEVKGETMTFYAVIVERPFHEHYVIGYPNGNFGPADNIDRASVATIIARAILPDFKEGANYGNPGGYSDVSGHWAESAIAYCSKYGVFEGYTDGTFKPNQPITRQEFALVIARLDGVMTPGEMDFSDIDEAGPWALGGIYTAYAKGWVNGYTDGTFKPLNNIRRDEAVKVFNAYLNRGVDADGLRKLHEYVHSGVASNNHENGTDEYMTWPDVPQGHWAYYEIVEAANDHEYVMDFESALGYTLPEEWDKCWIDERWRYHDDINDGGPNAAVVSAGFQIWLH